MVDRGRLDISKDLSFVDPRIISHTPTERVALLPENYVVGPWDVVCSGGRESFDHVGNRRFRYCIENNLPTYVRAKSKHERSLIVTIIVDAIRDSNAGGIGTGFVRKDLANGRWYEVGDKIAREKVSEVFQLGMHRAKIYIRSLIPAHVFLHFSLSLFVIVMIGGSCLERLAKGEGSCCPQTGFLLQSNL